MQKVLFIPRSSAFGKSPALRCAFLAKKEGSHAAIVLENKQKQFDFGPALKVYQLNTAKDLFRSVQLKKPFHQKYESVYKTERPPLFAFNENAAQQIAEDGLLNAKIIIHRMEQIGAIIKDFKPDMLVGDQHALTRLCGMVFNVPVVQVKMGRVKKEVFANWLEEPYSAVEPNGLEPFNAVFEHYNLEALQTVEQLYEGDKYITADKFEDEGVTQSSSVPLVDLQARALNNRFFTDLSDAPLIFISLDEELDGYYHHIFYESLIEIFNLKEFKVLVNTNNKVQAVKYSKSSVNMHFEDWIHPLSAMEKSDLVIHNGQYTTTMEAVAAGKPSIVMPLNAIQLKQAHILEDMQLAQTINVVYDMQLVDYKWPYENFNRYESRRVKINSKEMLDLATRLIYNSDLNRNKVAAEKVRQLQADFNLTTL